MYLYYGSRNLFTKPTFGLGNASNDYGLGFYMTPDKEMANLWASQYDNGGYSLKFKIDLSKLNILYLNTNSKKEILEWLTILVSHRFDRDEYLQRKETIDWLINKYPITTDGYDMIVGYRADDSYFKYSSDFVKNELSLEALSSAMKLGRLGLQYVLISKKAFDLVEFVSYERIPHSAAYERFRLKTLNEYRDIKKIDNINNTFIRDIMRRENHD